MKRDTGFMVWALLLVWAPASFSAAIGEPEQTGRFGYALSAAIVSVEDPDGPADDESEIFPWNVVYTDRWVGGFRYWAEGFYQEFTLAPSTSFIGQDVERYGVRLSAQRKIEWIESLQLWAGAGAILSRDSFSKRFTVDGDGFLASVYPDRDRNHLGIQLDLTSEWSLNRQWDIAGRLLYAPPIGEGVEELGVFVVFLYTR